MGKERGYFVAEYIKKRFPLSRGDGGGCLIENKKKKGRTHRARGRERGRTYRRIISRCGSEIEIISGERGKRRGEEEEISRDISHKK